MQLEQVIKEFGESVGFQSLEINSNGVVHMTITKVGDLFIDKKYHDESGGNVFVYLLRVYEHVDGELYRRALELCEYKPDAEFLVNPVLHGDRALGFAVKCKSDLFDTGILLKIIHVLKDLQDRLES